MTNIMSCGCDTTQKYDIVAVPDWNPVHIYGPNEMAKVNGVIYSSKGHFQNMIQGVFPGMAPIFGHIEFNLGQSPPNDKFWNTIPFNECFNSLTCTIALPPAAPTPASPQISDATAIATNNTQNVLPVNSLFGTISEGIAQTLAPGPVTENIEDEEEEGEYHTMPDGSQMKGSMYEAHILPNLPTFHLPNAIKDFHMEDIDTKHIIIGLAGALTLILLFKK